MSLIEHGIVKLVLGEKFPSRYRVWITNACSEDDRAFVLPTSAITTVFSSVFGLPGLAVAYLASATNVGYLINVGSRYGDLVSSRERQRLLVHESVHVWQGYNDVFANSFFAEAMFCHVTQSEEAYKFAPGEEWSSYNPEQQAMIVQNWFLAGMPESGPLWPYIKENFRPKPPAETRCNDYEETMALTCKE